MNSINKTARIAAILILIIVIFAPFSMIYVPSLLIAPDDATTTANNILASEGLFRLGMVSDAIIFLTEIALVVVLYMLLKPVSKTLSLIAAFSRLAMTIIQGVNMINQFFVLILLSNAEYLGVFEPNQIHALVLLFLNAHTYVVMIWGLFFGFHLLIFGYLVYKSAYIPRIIGIVLVIASICYFVQSIGNILFPEYQAIFASIGYLSVIEIALPLWLLIRGVNIQQWEKRTSEAVGLSVGANQ